MLVIGIPYCCVNITYDLLKYSMPTAKFSRVDGDAGWVEITGPGADEFEAGGVYVITELHKGKQEEKVTP